MNAKRLTTIAIAATLLIGGLAAVGAASPADAAAQNATNATGETNVTEETNASEETNATDDPAPDETADDGAEGVGPSDGLPEQAPDRVSEIHDAIESFLDGSGGDLGESLTDLLSGGDAADGNADDAGETNDADDEEMA